MRIGHRCSRRALLLGGGFGALAACSSGAAPTAAPTTAPKSAATAAPTAASPVPAKPTAAQPTSAPKPAAPTTAPVAKTKMNWKHGIVTPRFNAVFQYLPRDKGYFEEQGVDVEFVEIGTDATLVKGVLAGEFDSVEIGPQAMIASVEQGADIKIVGTLNPGLPAVLAVKSDVNQLSDLYGRPVAILGVGSFPDFLMQAMFYREGADKTKIEQVAIDNLPAAIQALVGGRVDASYASVDYVPDIQKAPDLKVLYDIAEKVPEVIRFAIIANPKAMTDKGEALTRYLTGYTKGIRFFIDNKAETVKYGVEQTKQPESEVERVYDWYVQKKLFQPNAYVDPKTLTAFQELNQTLGFQKTIMPPEKVATWDFQKKVVATLGLYPGFPG